MSREKVFVGQAVQQLNSSPDWGSYSKVILKTSDGEGYEAGDDTGLTLEADCPYATQAIANAVLASLQGGSYKPYEGSRAYITPAAEIGDGMTSDGFYSGIYSLSRQFSKTAAADIAAPSDTEVQHEIQYVNQSERRFTRKMKKISSEFAVMADEISAKVSEVGGDNQSFGWSMTTAGMYWYANGQQVMAANQYGLEIKGTLTSGSVITGDLYVGGTSIGDMINAATLRSGAMWPSSASGYSGYSNALWSNIAGGYVYASAQDTQSYPSYFSCGRLRIMTGLTMAGFDWGSQDIVINGRTYHVMVGQ